MRPVNVLRMRNPVSGGGDPDFANVTSLLPLSSDFTDVKLGAGWTVLGPTISGGEAVFDGVNDRIHYGVDTAFGFGAGLYTIEGFFTADSISGNQCLFDTRGGGEGIAFYQNAAAWGQATVYNNAGQIFIPGVGMQFTIGVSVHFAVVRDAGDVVRVYFNGVQQGSGADARTYAASTSCFIGDNYISAGAPSQPAHGKLKAWRVTKGVCRYPSGTAFTPPTLPLPTS